MIKTQPPAADRQAQEMRKQVKEAQRANDWKREQRILTFYD